ncbi:MAG: polysaccharide deacetylase, partial [Gammaproteobacteria bacterium]
MSQWQQLSAELDQWQARGRVATFWWRDDDAAAATPALERLLDLQRVRRVPLALAVIPARAGQGLASRLEHNPRIAVFQHGYAHENHAGEGERAIELGGQRRRERVV